MRPCPRILHFLLPILYEATCYARGAFKIAKAMRLQFGSNCLPYSVHFT